MLDTIIILKIGLAPVLILAASYAGYRWGNIVSGWLVGLPLTSAPVIFLLALERGGDFAAASAQGSMLGIISLSAFSLAFSWFTLRFRLEWLSSLALGWGVFFLSSLILQGVSLPLMVSFIGVVAWLLLVARLFPVVGVSPSSSTSSGFNWGDVIVRILAATSLILAITGYAPMLGPRLSGLLTPFPIYTSVLATSIYIRQGAESAVQFVRGATVSLFTPAVFFLVVNATIISWGVGISYALAIGVSIVIHWFLLTRMKRWH